METKDFSKRLRYGREWREKHKKYCEDCGKSICATSTRCHRCQVLWLWRTGQLNKGCFPKGEKSPFWKGGNNNNDGYRMIYNPGHHRATKMGYVCEHILVWEEANGKPLPEGWIIHHLNGIKSDNRPKNLAGLPTKKHYLILQAKAKRIQELEALLNGQHQLL